MRTLTCVVLVILIAAAASGQVAGMLHGASVAAESLTLCPEMTLAPEIRSAPQIRNAIARISPTFITIIACVGREMAYTISQAANHHHHDA